MESKSNKQKRLAFAKAKQESDKAKQEALDKQAAVIPMWHELNYDKQSELILATAERNETYRSFQSTKQDLEPLTDHIKNAWVYSIIAVVFAAGLDAFLWRNMFQTIDGLQPAVAKAAGLSLAIFVAIMAVFAGRALKERSSLNNPDEFNASQLAVFNKRTKHNKLAYALIPLTVVAIVIPVLRYEDTKSFLETLIFVGISYFTVLAVISVEYHMHDIWHAEIKQSKDLLDEAKNTHKIELKNTLKIGQDLIKIDPTQEVKFIKFMSNPKFNLLEEPNKVHTYTPKVKKASKQNES